MGNAFHSSQNDQQPIDAAHEELLNELEAAAAISRFIFGLAIVALVIVISIHIRGQHTDATEAKGQQHAQKQA